METQIKVVPPCFRKVGIKPTDNSCPPLPSLYTTDKTNARAYVQWGIGVIEIRRESDDEKY
nr:hypothetical protein NNONMNKP_00130 [Oryctes rhinoceros nudivirus]